MAAIIIKAGSTSITGATVFGSFSYFSGNTTQDLGPSEVTGFYQGIDAPDGGYAVYGLGGPSGVTVRIANDDSELNTILIQDGAPNITLAENIAWASSTGLVFINSGTASPITPTPTQTPTETPTETPTPTPTVTPTTSPSGGFSFDLGISNAYGTYACYNESSGNTQTLYTSASTLTVGTPLYYSYSSGFYSSGVTNTYVSDGTNYYYLDGSGTIQSYGGGSCPIPPNTFTLGISNAYGTYACYNESSGNTQTLYTSATTLTVGTQLYYTYDSGFDIYSSAVTNSYVSNGTNYYFTDNQGIIQSYGGGTCPGPVYTFTLGINNAYGTYACYNESSGNTQTLYSSGATLTVGTPLYYTYDSGFDIYSSAVTNSYVSNGTNYYYTDNQGIIQSYGGGTCPGPVYTFTLGINNISGDNACYNESSGNTQTIYSSGATLTVGAQLYYTYDSGFDIYSSAVTNSYVSNGTNYYYTDNQGIIQSYNTGDCPIPPSGRTGYFISAIYNDAVTGGTEATGVVFGSGQPEDTMCNPSTITLYANEISGLTAGTYYLYDADANKIRTFSAYGGSSYGSMSGVCTTPSGSRSGYYYATTRAEAISGGTQINSVTFGGGDMCTGFNATDNAFSSVSGYLYIYNADNGDLRQYFGSNSSTVSAMSACVNANNPVYYYSSSPNDCFNTQTFTNLTFNGGADICSSIGFNANEVSSLNGTYYLRSLFTDEFRQFNATFSSSVSFTNSCTYYSC